MTEGELARISAHQVPRQSQGGEQEDAEKNLQGVVGVDDEGNSKRQQEKPGRGDKLPMTHARWLPKIPLGFSDNTRMKMTKSTASAHSLPQYRLVRLSTTPSTSPAIAAP